jgi:hypothetical protein
VESGWDIKHVLRLIANSRVYRQSSDGTRETYERDRENLLLARQSAHRLPAEMVRDNVLSLSGLLVQQLGGPSVKPYQPAGYFRHLNFPPRRYDHHADDRQMRRGVYVHWQRQFLHPMLKAFDAPSREECTARRTRSNTPLASLVLLNDPTFVEAARGFAWRILQETAEDDDIQRLEFAFHCATSRRPDDVERHELQRLLDLARQEFTQNPQYASQLLAVGIASLPTTADRIELASWTTVARAILNLAEVNTRR